MQVIHEILIAQALPTPHSIIPSALILINQNAVRAPAIRSAFQSRMEKRIKKKRAHCIKHLSFKEGFYQLLHDAAAYILLTRIRRLATLSDMVTPMTHSGSWKMSFHLHSQPPGS